MFKKLRAKFILFSLILYFFVICISFFVFKGVINNIAESLGGRYAGKYALANSALLQEPLTREIALTRQMADSPVIKRWVLNEKSQDFRFLAFKELESYKKRLANHTWFYIIHSSLNYYYDDPKNRFGSLKFAYQLNKSNPKDAWYFATIRQERDYSLNVNYDRVLGIHNVWINFIVRDELGKTIGLAGTGLELSGFLKEFVDHNEEGVENIILDERLAIQACRDRSLIDYQSLAKLENERSTIFRLMNRPEDINNFRESLKRIDQGKSKAESLMAVINNKKMMIGISYVSSLGWYMLTILDVRNIIGNTVFIPILIIGIITSFLLILLIGYMINRLVLTPVAHLTSAASGISRGDFSYRFETKRVDEIGVLKQVFSQMASQIKKNTEELEFRVRERTLELNRISEELKIANETKDKFFSIIAHDLKNPVQALIGLSTLLKTDFDGYSAEQRNEMIQILNESSFMTYRLLENLLEWAYSQVGIISPKIERLSVDGVIVDNFELFKLQAQNKKIQLVFESADSFFVLADRNFLNTVMRNLLTNAIKFSHIGGTIQVYCGKKNGKQVEITILDHGIGISSHNLGKIFRMDMKFTTEGTSKEKGTGLGLLLCKDFVKKMGGEITVESTPQEGTKISFTLPQA